VPFETISSWRELDDALGDRSWVRNKERAHPATVFRGLGRATYRNVHGLARLEGDFAALEPHLLRSFRKYAHRFSPGPSTWYWLSLAQHHGLPTRLLDWTYSPLVALHFATLGPPDEEAVLWEVDCEAVHSRLPVRLRAALEEQDARVFTTDMLDALAPDLGALDGLGKKEPFLLFFEPPSLDARIDNQAAVLSVACSPSLQVEDWLPEHEEAWRGWRIGADAKLEIRARLDQSNVTERVLMPGLDGVAAWLRRYYSPQTPHAADEGGASMDERG
jgi:hypothetical protein